MFFVACWTKEIFFDPTDGEAFQPVEKLGTVYKMSH